MHASLLAVLGIATLATLAPAQGCPGPGTFWKRDTLPVAPAGLTSVGVVAGMCEGESAGVVFEMPANMAPQRITQVVAPWGHAFGTNGFTAALDIEIYDGVSFNGAVVNMGTQVFSLTGATQSNMQVTTHGLNTFDVSPYGIVVGTAPATGSPPVRRFAVCFRCDLNTLPDTCNNGSGQANFFTDATSLIGLQCNNTITPQRTSVMEIQGQGWRDPALATVGGLPLCPLYYRGVFCIRCCTEDAFPAYYTNFAGGCPSSLGIAQLIPATQPRLGTTLFVIVNNMPANLGLMITGTSNAISGFGPLPADMTPFGLTGCSLHVSADFLTTLVGGGFSASYSLTIPNNNGLLGVQLYQQPFVFDPPLNAFGGALGNAAALQIGS